MLITLKDIPSTIGCSCQRFRRNFSGITT